MDPEPVAAKPQPAQTAEAAPLDGRRASHHARGALRRQIQASPLSQCRIEQRAGFSRGYLSQVLAGNLDLKLSHVLAVLEALGVAPGRFFAGLYPDIRRTALATFRERRDRDLAHMPRNMDAFYDLGIESLSGLRQRLERCERAVEQLEGLGIVNMTSQPRGEHRE
jgi:transcriptional regulator with XRE-family HTH domain